MANRKKYGSEVKWIAISINIFDDEKIKIIEEMPEGDTIIVVWLKLLISAGRVNDCGMVYIDKNIPYTIETLATVFHRPINTVRLALDTFQRLGMITISDTRTILLKNWYKYQQQDSLEKIREQGRIRQQRFRENQAEKLLENKSNVTSNANVTLHNALHDITLHDNTQHDNTQHVPKFFEWYKDHIRLVPVGKYVPGTLKNYETSWFLDKVDADRRAYEYTHKRPWTDDDDAWLEMLIEKRATYKECSEKLKRTGAAIKRRCLDKKLPKPKRLPAKKWTREEFETLKRLWLAGYEPCIIAEELKYRSDRMVLAMLERYEYFGMHRQKFMKGESDVRNT